MLGGSLSARKVVQLGRKFFRVIWAVNKNHWDVGDQTLNRLNGIRLRRDDDKPFDAESAKVFDALGNRLW